MTHWVATKAIEALSSKTVELANYGLNTRPLRNSLTQTTTKRRRITRKKYSPKGRHLVEADDIVQKTAGVEQGEHATTTSKTLRSSYERA